MKMFFACINLKNRHFSVTVEVRKQDLEHHNNESSTTFAPKKRISHIPSSKKNLHQKKVRLQQKARLPEVMLKKKIAQI